MDEPEKCDRRREPWPRLADLGAETLPCERPADERPEEEAVREMEHEIEGVIALDVEPAERVVDGEAQVDERAPGDGAMDRRQERHPRRPEMPDGRIPGDRLEVVEEERAVEAVGVRGDARADEEERSEPGAIAHRQRGAPRPTSAAIARNAAGTAPDMIVQ